MTEIDQVIARGEPLPPFDVHVRLMSLPGIFGTRLESISAIVPYLSAEPSRVEQWRRKLGGSGAFKIGIAWQGNPKFPSDKRRSIPIAHFAPLSDLPGVRLFSLQKGFGTEQLKLLADQMGIVRFTPALARSVYQHNDEHAELIRRINVLLNSRLVQEKSCHETSSPTLLKHRA
jgi:hypothetical protein